MLKVATVFSGIGAIEHALKRMNIDHKIVFACDNGDVDILSKKINNSLQDFINEYDFLRNSIVGFEPENEFDIELNEYITNYGEWNLFREVIIPLFQEAITLPDSQTVLVRLNWFPNQKAWTFASLIAQFEQIFGTDSESLDLYSKNKGE